MQYVAQYFVKGKRQSIDREIHRTEFDPFCHIFKPGALIVPDCIR